LRGVAKRARRSKSSFGAGLERLSHVRMAYFQRETRELVNLDSCELIRSQFGLVSDYWPGVALDYFAEVSEQLLPNAEPNEKFFRLLVAVLESLSATRGRGPSVAGGGVLFAMGGAAFRMAAGVACMSRLRDGARRNGGGVFQPRPGRIGLRELPAARRSWELTVESRGIAQDMLRNPVARLAAGVWSQGTAADLRRFLVQQIEAHANGGWPRRPCWRKG